MQVLVAHPGTQHAARLAGELAGRGLLGEFWTGLALAEGGAAARLAVALRRLGPFRALSNRIARGVPPDRLRCRPANELRALFRLRRGEDGLRVLHERNRRFQESVPEHSLQTCDAIVGFDTSAWQLAARARKLGRPLYLDRTIAHPAVLLRLETELHHRYPEWCPSAKPRPDYLAAAEAEEHRLARCIIVGGSFARDTLLAEGIAADRIMVNPYGVDWARFNLAPPAAGGRPFRFLFLGSHLARKGLPVLLDAWRILAARRGDAELWLAGPCGPRERRLIPDLPGLKILGEVPHTDVPGLMARTDVLVLPSYFEGFGLVLLEALAAGLPFIATPHTGAVDLPPGDPFGRSVPVGSVEALRAALEHYLGHPPDRAAVLAACSGIRDQFSWTAYGDRWAALLQTV
ncbi:MAG: glycosyltransferase family 4 protein [Opitutae bacterium]|nr:glycosyltransferase family 4 protein [Opitutae bacterium]